jgi:hypothetical protein
MKQQKNGKRPWAAMAEKDEHNFYNQVIKFIRGEGHDIRPGTIGMIQAEIAKRLVAFWQRTSDLI